MVATSQYKVTYQRVKVTAGFTTDAVVCYPPNYDSLRKKPYPIAFWGQGLGNTPFSNIPSKPPISQIISGMIPQGEFVIIDVYRNYTSWVAHEAYAMREFKKRGMNIDTTNIFQFGHSAGGGKAASSIYGSPTAGNNFDSSFSANVRAVVALAPNQDFRRDNYNNIYKFPIPQWVVVGANDNGAYITMANELNTQGNNRITGIVELKVLAGQGHGGWESNIYNGSIRMESGKTMWEFFVSKLKDATPVPVTEVSRYEIIFKSDGSKTIQKVSGADQTLQNICSGN